LLSIDVLLTWATTSFASIDVRTLARVGTSNYRLRSLARHTMNLMTGFSLIPLQVATLSASAFTLFRASPCWRT
jgi:undecaprenyl-phosphate 4-deoxy-4-formamido-L-arabinose transferase